MANARVEPIPIKQNQRLARLARRGLIMIRKANPNARRARLENIIRKKVKRRVLLARRIHTMTIAKPESQSAKSAMRDSIALKAARQNRPVPLAGPGPMDPVVAALIASKGIIAQAVKIVRLVRPERIIRKPVKPA